MSRIKAKNTKPEMLVRKFLHANGLRYRLHEKNLPGKPDIVLKKRKKVIFIHGCYWHGHKNCGYYKPPKTRTDWWNKKIGSNIRRDDINLKTLTDEGWQVLIVWECELKGVKKDKTLENLLQEVANK